MAIDVGGERAHFAPQDDEAPEQPLVPHERDREERAHALPGQKAPCLGRDRCGLVCDVGDLDGFADHAGATDRPLAQPDRMLLVPPPDAPA